MALALNRSRQVKAEDSTAFGTIAERFRRAGDLQRAVSLCEEGLQKFPDHLSARVTLGWALLDLGRHRDARLQLEAALRRAPDNLAAIRGLAQLHYQSSESGEGYAEMDPADVWPPLDAVAPVEEQPAAVAAAPSDVAEAGGGDPYPAEEDPYAYHQLGEVAIAAASQHQAMEASPAPVADSAAVPAEPVAAAEPPAPLEAAAVDAPRPVRVRKPAHFVGARQMEQKELPVTAIAALERFLRRVESYAPHGPISAQVH